MPEPDGRRLGTSLVVEATRESLPCGTVGRDCDTRLNRSLEPDLLIGQEGCYKVEVLSHEYIEDLRR